MSKIYTFLFVLGLSAIANAQDTTEKLLNEVVITTNKYPKKQSNTGKVITVIDAQMLQQMAGRNIGEILNTVAGVNINGANNNLGTNQGVSIRGASFGNALILIDGIPVNDPSLISNYFDLNFINPDNIERIEVLKGGQSTLYGSDAVAGVINIITKKYNSQKALVNAGVNYGSYNTLKGLLGISGTIKKLQYNLTTTNINSKGFSSAYDSTNNKNFEKDGFKQSILKADVKYALTDALAIRLFGNYSKYNADIDAAAFKDDKDYTIENKNTQAGIGLTWSRANGNLQVNYHFNHINRYYLNDSADRSDPSFYYISDDYIGRTHFAELYKNFKLNSFELLTGVDYRYNNASNKTVYTFTDFFTGLPVTGNSKLEDSIANAWQLSPYASLVYSKWGLNIELGGRLNYHNQYGNNGTYTFNPSYLIIEKIKLFANASSAFKAPSLYQLYADFIGYKNLEPETSTILEGGIELYLMDQMQFRITNFYRKTKNAIQYIIIDPATFESGYRNISSQKNNGLEVEFFFRNKKWNISSNYTFTKGETTTNYSDFGYELSKDTTFNSLYRTPKNAFNAFVSYNLNSKINVSSVVRFIGERLEPVYGDAPELLDNYHTIDISAGYKLNNNFNFFIDLNNITIQKYFDILGYNTRRFNWTIGITAKY